MSQNLLFYTMSQSQSRSQSYSEELCAGSQLTVSIKIPYLPMYKPWIHTQTQGFWSLYTEGGGGLIDRGGGIRKDNKMESFEKYMST